LLGVSAAGSSTAVDQAFYDARVTTATVAGTVRRLVLFTLRAYGPSPGCYYDSGEWGGGRLLAAIDPHGCQPYARMPVRLRQQGTITTTERHSFPLAFLRASQLVVAACQIRPLLAHNLLMLT